MTIFGDHFLRVGPGSSLVRGVVYNPPAMLDRFTELEEQPYSEDDAEWDRFVGNHEQGSILQTTAWARLKNRFGWRSHRVWLRQENELVAGAQVLFRSAALGLFRIAYIPHGPLVAWDDMEQVSVLFNQLDHAVYNQGASLLKMEPLLWHRDMPAQHWQELCRSQECIPDTHTIQPPRTIVVDLTPSEDEILSRMKQKTRYNIRLSERKGVATRRGTLEDVAVFNNMIQATGQRNEFGVHSGDYYRAAYELFEPDHIGLFLAEYQGKPLAAIMVFILGRRAAYLYGASSNEERQRMPSYAAQWAAMKWAKAEGCQEYDLWGVPDYPEEQLENQFRERQDGLWGVYRFKRGFGGSLQRTVGTADRVYNSLVYRLYKWRTSR